MTHADVIFIGGGTATLTAANFLLDNGFSNFLILEKGLPAKKRHCPGEHLNTCTFCSAGCYTLEGQGGANANHGNKICYFPSSDNIRKSFDFSEKSFNYLNKLLFPYISIQNEKIDQNISEAKKYHSDVLNQKHFAELVATLSNRINDKILFEINVTDVFKQEKGFELLSETGDKFACQHVVFGTGRTSYKQIKKVLLSLGLSYVDQPQDIGIRIETNKEFFSEKYYYQVDPKFKYVIDGLGGARTFCAHNQGKVVPVQYGNSFYADGAFGKEFTLENNIALLVRSKNYVDDSILEKWCSYTNSVAGGQLVLGEIKIGSLSKENVVDQILHTIPSFPTANHGELMKVLLRKLIIDDNKLFNDNFFEAGYLRIYGPAIDLYWPKPALDSNLQSIDLNGFYVIGDATGVSRGFFQGIYSGAEWAIKFLSKTQPTEISNDKIWSSRIPSSI